MFWKWNGIIFIRPTLLALLKHNCIHFILSYFIGQFALISFSTKSVELTTPTAIFAVDSLHLFCECEKVSPLWDELCFLISNISWETFNFSNFDKMFGIKAEQHPVVIFAMFCSLFQIVVSFLKESICI